MTLENVKGIKEGSVVAMPEGESLVTYLDREEINTICRGDGGILLTQRWVHADGKVDYRTKGQELNRNCSTDYNIQNEMLTERGL
jgi:hypothetical protein